ncbi:uncharacterized protein LOC105443522 [Strongylocentrotus purpuratus]|uniref:Uncharacterized protein n=1 Tax=Strongylocentrotus purpuratus TaxID=7668 RepID=A0A7M7NQC5_STRPU|nr:uncharacterized protein LOC105443522 [Strongylocentrotus purpuratus]
MEILFYITKDRDFHIEGLQKSEIVHSAGHTSEKSHSYQSEALHRSKTLNSTGQPNSDNSHCYMTKCLHRSKTLQNEDSKRPKTFNSENLQTPDELYSHSFSDSTHHPFEERRGINHVLQKGLKALILQISMLMKIVLKYRHVFIFMVFLTRATCANVQVPVRCTSVAVITSPNYPSTYPQFKLMDWFLTAPKGRMILLTFTNFSLGSSDDVVVIDIVNDRKRQRYNGEQSTIPPFLSKRNSLLLRFTSNGNPTGYGFNISASCFELSGTRVGRLEGGNTPAEGFLELQAESGGEWMRVCAEHSAERVAEVVCGELGFPGVKEMAYKQGGCSLEGADPDCIRAPSCGKNAYLSQDCSASSEKCASSLAVKVKCFEPGFKGCSNLGNTRLQNGFSFESTSECITTCRADTSQAIAIINGSECFCSTTDDIVLLYPIKDQSCALHQLVYNASFGFCNQTDDVMNGSWDSSITWFGSIVHLTCNDGYSLNGNGTLQCVTGVSSYIHVWNGTIPTCEMIKIMFGHDRV